MLIIWGFRARMKRLDSGHFHCPNEGGDRDYHRVEARRWFTLFWIPLIPLKVLGEYVECASCGADYDPRVLTLPTNAQIEDRLTSALRHVVVAMIHADDHVADEERRAGVEVVNQFGLHAYSAADLDEDLRTLQVGDLDEELAGVAGTLSPQGQEAVMHACVTLAGADGRVDPSELQMLQRAGRGLGMSPAHVRGVLAEIEERREHA
jgi:uncharacterized tellurite resistance protein B-like protein